jgi:hypothetical protein
MIEKSNWISENSNTIIIHINGWFDHLLLNLNVGENIRMA